MIWLLLFTTSRWVWPIIQGIGDCSNFWFGVCGCESSLARCACVLHFLIRCGRVRPLKISGFKCDLYYWLWIRVRECDFLWVVWLIFKKLWTSVGECHAFLTCWWVYVGLAFLECTLVCDFFLLMSFPFSLYDFKKIKFDSLREQRAKLDSKGQGGLYQENQWNSIYLFAIRFICILESRIKV